MSVEVAKVPLTVALLGNPNTGKSTLFSSLVGVRQRVGNYPGVTVEKKLGRLELPGHELTVIDLPGTYSLAPRSPDEMVAVDVLLGRRDDTQQPDAVICIVDASNLERNLYLVSQALEFGLPTIVVLNMIDVAQERQIELDIDLLRQRLGVPVIPMQANRQRGLKELKAALDNLSAQAKREPVSPFPEEFKQEVDGLIRDSEESGGEPLPRYLAERLLLDSGGYIEQSRIAGITPQLIEKVKAARERLAAAGMPVPAVEAMARYAWVGEVLEGVVRRPEKTPTTWSDRIDRVLTHKVLGTVIFVALMLVVFQSIFTWALPLMDLIEAGQGVVAGWVAGVLPEGAFRSLLIDGVIAGVGGVVVFLPQIFILFFFIALLEDCGYMARAAYLMDKLMSRVGLSGKSFIPLLSSFACAIPGIMSARVIENRRDRLLTILIAPLMSCSARVPVYVLLIAAFIPATQLFGWYVKVGTIELFGGAVTLGGEIGIGLGLPALVFFLMYCVGAVAAVIVTLLLRRTMLKGPTPAFVMELPSYKLPSVKLVLWRMWESGWAFIRRAGTLILAVAIIVWALAYFPRTAPELEAKHAEELSQLESGIADIEKDKPAEGSAAAERLAALKDEKAAIENRIAGQQIRHSFLGQMGQAIEPVVRPLGWDWRVGCAAISSFPAREVVVGTLGVIYNLGEQDEESPQLRRQLQTATWDDDPDRKVFNIPVALSLMVFFALCAQCAATLAVMKRETNSWRWPVFSFVYMTGLAYVAALATYQIGMLFL